MAVIFATHWHLTFLARTDLNFLWRCFLLNTEFESHAIVHMHTSWTYWQWLDTFRVQSNLGLLWFCCTSLCDWSRKLAPLSQPITAWYFPLSWLAVVIILALVSRHSIQKHYLPAQSVYDSSSTKEHNTPLKIHKPLFSGTLRNNLTYLWIKVYFRSHWAIKQNFIKKKFAQTKVCQAFNVTAECPGRYCGTFTKLSHPYHAAETPQAQRSPGTYHYLPLWTHSFHASTATFPNEKTENECTSSLLSIQSEIFFQLLQILVYVSTYRTRKGKTFPQIYTSI